MPYTSAIRPMTEDERSIVKKWTRTLPTDLIGDVVYSGCDTFPFALLGAGIGGFLGILIATIILGPDQGWDIKTLAVYIGLAVGFFAVIALVAYKSSRELSGKRDLKIALAANTVEETRYSASNVTRVISEYDEDIFGGLVYQIDENELLSVSEIDLKDDEFEFPCLEFNISKLPNDGPILKIEFIGNPSPSAREKIIKTMHESFPQGTCQRKGTLEQLDMLLKI